MNNNKIAVIGDGDSVMSFKAAGAEVFSPSGQTELRELFRKLLKLDYPVIFITEKLFAGVSELVSATRSKAYPAVIPIPDSTGSDGTGMAGIRHDMEKATGADIFTKNK